MIDSERWLADAEFWFVEWKRGYYAYHPRYSEAAMWRCLLRWASGIDYLGDLYGE